MTADQQAWIASMAVESRSARRAEQLRRLLRMQRAAEHLETARLLEQRADRAAPVLASLLRERAAERRAWCELLRSGPAETGRAVRRGPAAYF